MRNLALKKGLVIFIASILITLLISSPVSAFASTTTAVDNVPTFTTIREASDYFYNQLFDHQENIQLSLITSNGNGKEVWQSIKDGAFIDNAEDPSLLGDYARYNYYNSAKIKYSYTQSNGKYNYTFNFDVTYRATESQDNKFESKLTTVMDSLSLENMSDYQKVKTIYDYICDTVDYDYNHSSTYYQKYTAYAALVNKTAVCQGYANLFYRMCKEAGIPVRIVTGTSKNQSHAWNIVALDGKYYNVDATWDAGKSNYSYFLKSNSEFNDHKRNSEYTASSFNSQQPMNTKSYYAISSAQPKLTVKSTAKTAQLSWTKCSNASGYKVYRATSKTGSYKEIATVSSKTTKYTNKNLTKSKNYYYKVKAYQKVNKTSVYSKTSAVKAVSL